jgi:NDP-sugar pyrophosphorylase family protein
VAWRVAALEPRRAREVGTVVAPPVVLLAGGLGTRLRPITGAAPKALAPLAPDMPLLRYALSFWAARGADKIVLCLGYEAQAVEKELGRWGKLPVQLQILTEREPLGTGGAVLSAMSVLPDEFFVINGDTVVDVSLKAINRWHHAHDWDATMLVAPRPTYDQADYLKVLSDGTVTALSDRTEPRTWAYAGVALLRRRLLGDVFVVPPASLEGDVLAQALRVGKRLGALRTRRPFYDLGTPERLLSFRTRLRNGRVH